METVEVREDEEQTIKQQETMELLVAAGYFRARIKGLHPFDKIVGGMVWCLEVCNLDIDVDLDFRESLTIGQKIALTEKIVGVLPELNCPHRLDPHQVQGLDFVHIFPVMQWLVKKAIETREESGDINRAEGLRHFETLSDSREAPKKAEPSQERVQETLSLLNDAFAPRRRFRRKAGVEVPDVESQVRFTLLEYENLLSTKANKNAGASDNKSKPIKDTASTAGGDFIEITENLEKMDDKRRVKASLIGNLVSRQAEEISQMEALHEEQVAHLEEMSQSGPIFGINKEKHMYEMALRQLEELKAAEESMISERRALEERMEELKQERKRLKEMKLELDKENEELDDVTKNLDEDRLKELSSLLETKRNLEQNISTFRADCKKEAAVLKEEYQRLVDEVENPAEQNVQKRKALEDRLAAERESLKAVRLKLAEKNREIAMFQRRLDDIPSQAELSQYQKRFIELYDQIAAKLRETKKYYTLYNTLTDSKMYYEKEVQLLESIHDNFERALGSEAGKEQFIRQLEQILEGLRQTMAKADKRRIGEKLKRDQLNDRYQELLEKQRLYYKLVKEFQEECAKNEALQ